MEKNLVINIGLNVGTTEPLDQLETTLDILSITVDFTAKDYRIYSGQWQIDEVVITERVLVVEISAGNLTPFSLDSIFGAMVEHLNQDAMAFKLNGVGHMVFSDSYKGERFEFNEDYFKTF